MSDDPGFGHAGHAWVPDLRRDPADVAAAYLQHRMILAAREELGERATAPRFAEALGVAGNGPTKHVQRLLSGVWSLGVPDLLRWCHVFDIDLVGLVGDGLGGLESYPPVYRG